MSGSRSTLKILRPVANPTVGQRPDGKNMGQMAGNKALARATHGVAEPTDRVAALRNRSANAKPHAHKPDDRNRGARIGGEQFKLEQLECLACARECDTNLMASHASMVHGEMDCRRLEAVAPPVCDEAWPAMNTHYMSVESARRGNAVAPVGSFRRPCGASAIYAREGMFIRRTRRHPELALRCDVLRGCDRTAPARLYSNLTAAQPLKLRIDWTNCFLCGNDGNCMSPARQRRKTSSFRMAQFSRMSARQSF